MDYKAIKYQREDSVVTITLSNSAHMNSISVQMLKDLRNALGEVKTDPTIRVLVITGGPDGKGRPCFCAGADLQDPEILTYPNFVLEGDAMLADIEDMPIPTIAAIDGACTAGGLEIALVCDIRIVSDTVRIGDTHLKVVGGPSRSQSRLARIVGKANAKFLHFTGELVNGPKSVVMGLATESVPSDQLMTRVKEIANKVASLNPIGVRATKADIDIGMEMNTHQAFRLTDRILALANTNQGDLSTDNIKTFKERNKNK